MAFLCFSSRFAAAFQGHKEIVEKLLAKEGVDVNQASENKVKFIRLWFTDLFGNIKGFGITDYEFEKVLNEGMSFDGSSIFGTERSNETEMIAFPDPTTLSKEAVSLSFWSQTGNKSFMLSP